MGVRLVVEQLDLLRGLAGAGDRGEAGAEGDGGAGAGPGGGLTGYPVGFQKSVQASGLR